MTINSDTRKAGPYLGDGAAVTLPFAFKVFQASDLRVVRTNTAGTESNLVLDSDYTVALNPNQDTSPGGTITLAVPAEVGARTTIGSAIAPLQKVQLANNGGFYADVINGALDRLTILVQQLVEAQGRSVHVPFSDSGGGFDLAGSAVRANKVLGFDASGNPAFTVPVSGSAADVALQLGTLINYLAAGLSVDGGGNVVATHKVITPRLVANNTDDSGTPDAAVWVHRTLTALNINGGHGLRDDSTITGGTAGTGYAAFDAQHTLTATGFDHTVSFQSRPIINGDPVHVYGLTHGPTFNGGAHAINSYGLFVFNPVGSGTVENVYGIYIPIQSKGSVSNHPLYVAQQGGSSFIGSPLHVNNVFAVDWNGTTGAPFVIGANTTTSYPYAGYNYDPTTGSRMVADVVVTTKFDGSGWRVFTKASGAVGAVTPDEVLRVDLSGNVYGVAGAAAMTNGFHYMPSGAGAPGAPAVQPAGRVPFYFDTSTNKIGVYTGGAWKWTAALV